MSNRTFKRTLSILLAAAVGLMMAPSGISRIQAAEQGAESVAFASSDSVIQASGDAERQTAGTVTADEDNRGEVADNSGEVADTGNNSGGSDTVGSTASRGNFNFCSVDNDADEADADDDNDADDDADDDDADDDDDDDSIPETITESGQNFSELKAYAASASKTSVKLKWSDLTDAEEYVVYAAKCGKNSKLTKVEDTEKTSYICKNLKKKTYYKFVVVALDEDDEIISKSMTVIEATKGGKVTNVKSLKVANGKKISVKKGKKVKIKTTVKKEASSAKVKNYRKLSYESSNTGIAAVSKKGVVKAKKKGSCYVYVYAQNGVHKKIKVVVK